VIRECAERYGQKVAGWWFDSAHARIPIHETITRLYSGDERRAGTCQEIIEPWPANPKAR